MYRIVHFKALAITIVCTQLCITLFHSSANAEPLAAGADKFLGNISTAAPPSNFLDYWNQVTLEDNGKWANVEPNRDQMKWDPITAAYNFCLQNKIPYKHHCFVWKEQAPSWMNNLSAKEQKEEVEELIKTFGQKFPETAFIDVVNEAREKSPAWKTALGGAGETGYDWIVWAFETARKYCPKAKLLINEYYCEYNLEYVTEYLKIVKVLKEKNLIDGIGLQCHDGETKKGYDMGVFKQCLDSLATSGVPLYATEFDISGNDSVQLHYFSNIFPIMWEHPAIHGVTLWGWTDSWLLRISNPRDGRLIINGKERPALKWLREYMATHKHVTPVVPSFQIVSPSSGVAVSNIGNGILRLQIPDAQSLQFRVFDPSGKLVNTLPQQWYGCGEHNVPVLKNRMAPGMYIISVKGDGFHNVINTQYAY
jgi:endo-1,4-beta-xylanase